MSVTKITISELLSLSTSIPILDVRSPGEYSHARIPGAESFPLFTDLERKVIGTAYKQESRERAIKIGLEAFGKNMVKMLEEAEHITKARKSGSKKVIVHCWRGGMRSAAVAWLLDLYGFEVYLLSGGYKSFRGWAIKQFEKQYSFGIIGGYTGSNKTGIIHELKNINEHVIDLEGLAGHKGSAFGNLDQTQQPSQEQFENLLAYQLNEMYSKDLTKTIWIENESQRIGDINLPNVFFIYFNAQASYFLNVPFDERLKHVINLYGAAPKENLINAIVRIKKKLGGLEAKAAIACLLDDDTAGCFSILLNYYDKLYRKLEIKRKQDQKQVFWIDSDTTDAKINLQKLLQHAGKQ